MKNLLNLILLASLSATSAFAATGGGSSVGPANPAAQLCEKIGGHLAGYENSHGQGYNCVIEEWTLFRAMDAQHLVKPIQCGASTQPCMPNPASVNCENIGGSLEIVDSPNGQYGMCTVEEWKLFGVFNQ
jgi:putative hemolysin